MPRAIKQGVLINKTFIYFLLLIILVPFAFLPMPGYFSYLIFLISLYLVLTHSWNLMAGYVGLYSFGNHAFIGVGGYAAAMAFISVGVPAYVCIIIGGVMAMLVAALIGSLCFRAALKGAYFAIATLAICEVLRVIFLNWEYVGGSIGVYIPETSYGQSTLSFRDCLLIALIFAWVVSFTLDRLVNSKNGVVMKAIREDELSAQVLGVNSFKYKMIAFLTSSFICGVAGAMFAFFNRYIEPHFAFSTSFIVSMQMMAIFGGLGTLLGPLLGSVVLTVLAESLRYSFLYLHLVIYGVFIIIALMLVPEGLVGVLKKLRGMGSKWKK